MKISDAFLAVLAGALDLAWKLCFAFSVGYYVSKHEYPAACAMFCIYLGMLQKESK